MKKTNKINQIKNIIFVCGIIFAQYYQLGCSRWWHYEDKLPEHLEKRLEEFKSGRR